MNELDLKIIEGMAKNYRFFDNEKTLCTVSIPALVAEVQRLQAERDDLSKRMYEKAVEDLKAARAEALKEAEELCAPEQCFCSVAIRKLAAKDQT